jgi:hypothetical protein
MQLRPTDNNTGTVVRAFNQNAPGGGTDTPHAITVLMEESDEINFDVPPGYEIRLLMHSDNGGAIYVFAKADA